MQDDFDFHKHLLDIIPDSILIHDLEGNILYANESAYKSRGYTYSEFLGLNLRDLEIPAYAESNKSRLQEILTNEEYTYESAHLYKSKSVMSVEIRTRIINYNNQKCILNVIRNIENRLQNEYIKGGFQAQQQLIMDNLPDAMWWKDKEGKFKAVNKSFLNTVGRGVEAIIGHTDFDFLPREMAEKNTAKDQQIIQSGQGKLFEEYLIKHDRPGVWIESLKTPLRNSQGEIVGLMGISRDITLRKQIEEKLKESEERFRLLVENAKDIIFHLRLVPKIEFEYISPSVTAITGYTPDEHKADPEITDKMIHPDDIYIRRNTVNNPSHDKYLISYRIIRKDGQVIWVEQLSILLKDKDGTVVAVEGIIRDITERKKMEEQILDLYQQEKKQREELQKEAKNRGILIDALAHELRTPLTPLLVSSEILQDLLHLEEDEKLRKLAKTISDSSHTLARRLEEMLELAKYSRGIFTLKIQPVDIRNLVEVVISNIKPITDRCEQQLIVEMEPDLNSSRFDPVLLEQVLINLLSNASKFSPAKEKIFLRIKTVADSLVIEVTDHSMRISEEELSRLFQPYHLVEQDRHKFPGMGLGIELTKQIVEAHGGNIWINSQLGQGNTFGFRIPQNGKV